MSVDPSRAFLRVPGKWLATCGYGTRDRVFPVIRVLTKSDWWTFATIDRDGSPWVVHVPCRGATFQSTGELHNPDSVYLARLAAWVESHPPATASVNAEDGYLTIYTESVDRAGNVSRVSDRVRTLSDARAVLGY